MKKIVSLIVLAVLAFGIFSLASCKKDETDINVGLNVYDSATFELTSESYAFAVKKDNATLLASANELLAELKANGDLDIILNSFFDGTATFEYTNPVSSIPTGADKANYLIVATNAYFPPFEYYNGNKITGIDMKIASLLAEKLGKTLYIADMEFDSVIPSVQSGESDIGMAGMTVTEARMEAVNFTNTYYTSAQVLVARIDDTAFANCKNAADIETVLKAQKSSFVVGTQNGTTGYMYSKGDADFGYDGYTNLTTKGYNTGALALMDLRHGKINAVILDKQPALSIVESMNAFKVYGAEVYELTAESYAFAVKKENAALLASANELLAELKGNGQLDTILNSFFDGTATFEYINPVSSIPTGADKANYLIVATNAYFPPFEYYNGNRLTGIDMKIASLLAEKLGKTLYIADMEFDSVIPSVQSGESDIGMAGMTVTDARKEAVNFTDTYYTSAQVLVVKNGDSTFADCKSAADIENKLKAQSSSFIVGTQNGTTGYMYSKGDEDFGYDGFTNLTTKGYNTGALAMMDLKNGKVNAVIIDKQPALSIAKSIGW